MEAGIVVDEGRARAGGEEASSRLGDLGDYIRNQRKGAQLSLRHLARLAGVSNPYLSQIERGLRKPSAEILQAIAKALEISSETLYVKAGILEAREVGHDVEVALARDGHLTDQQRQALIEMYRSFRRLAQLQSASDADRGAVRGLIEAVTAGTVDDTDLHDASLPDEDAEEA